MKRKDGKNMGKYFSYFFLKFLPKVWRSANVKKYMETVDDILERLGRSHFRSGFHLKKKDIEYISEKKDRGIFLLVCLNFTFY